jgi:hypothetical protein
MNPARIIYDDAPAYIPVPAELQHQRIEAILWPLEDAAGVVPAASDSETRGNGEVTAESAAPRLPSLADFRATLPLQTLSAVDLCREMRDEDRY